MLQTILPYEIGVLVVLVILTVLLYAVVWGIFRIICLKVKLPAIPVSIILFCVAIGIRVFEFITVFQGTVSTDNIWMQAAGVSYGHSVPLIVHGAGYLYGQVLSVLFFLLGNMADGGLVMQIVLQILAIAFFYAAFCRQMDRNSANLGLLVLSVSPTLINLTGKLGPECLYLFLFSTLFYTVSSLSELQNKKLWFVLLHIFTGIFCGILCYLDITGILILIFVLFMKKSCLKNKIIGFSLALVSGVASFAAIIIADGMATGSDSSVVFMQQMLQYRGTGSFSIPAFPDNWFVFAIVLTLIVLLYSAGFWYQKKNELIISYFFSFVLFLIFSSFCNSVLNVQLFFTLIFAGFSCCSIYKIAVCEENEKTPDVFEKIVESEESGIAYMDQTVTLDQLAAQAVSEDTFETIPLQNNQEEKVEKTLQKEKVLEDSIQEDPLEAVLERMNDEAQNEWGKRPSERKHGDRQNALEDRKEVSAEAPKEVHKNMVKQNQKTKFIENPLPGPKKHVKKVLDYQFDVPEHLMKYDIDVPDTDDFDL